MMQTSIWKKGLGNFGHRFHSRRKDESGVALITALIILGVSMLLGLSIMLTTSSDVFISGSMRNSKTAFYAADAGVGVMRTALVNALKAATPNSLAGPTNTVFNCTDPAFSASILSTALVAAGNGSPQYLSSYSSSGASPATYAIDTGSDSGQPRTSFSCINMQAPPGLPAPRNELYTFGYQITSNGAVPGTAANPIASTVIEQGTITYNINVNITQSLNNNPYQTVLFSFAGYGMFIDNYDPHSGQTLLHGTITGRVHTNGEWGFSSGSPNYVFTDRVSSVNQDAYYLFGSSGYDSDSSSYTYTTGHGHNATSTTIAPQFMSGFDRGVTDIPLPPNSNSQSRAVIDGSGINLGSLSQNPPDLTPPPAPTPAELGGVLRNADGPYGGGNGVYVPIQMTLNGYGPPTYTTLGAGIYINGNVDSMTVNASTPGLQVFTITQGSTTTTVTYNLTPNTINGYPPQSTTIANSAGSSITSTGLPTSVYPVNPNRPAVIQPTASASIYVNGSINSLRGPADPVTGQSLPAVQDHAAMTITATGNVTVTGNLLYNTPPVTTSAGQVAPGVPANSPPGTLIPGNDYGQALGIYSSGGNIYLNVDNIPSRNIEIDGSMATLVSGGQGGITVSGSNYANNITVIGGRIQNNIMVLGNSSTVRNVFFDRRFANGAYAPPFFPSTSASVERGNNQTTTNQYTVAAPANSLRAYPTSYTVPSRLVAATNAGQ